MSIVARRGLPSVASSGTVAPTRHQCDVVRLASKYQSLLVSPRGATPVTPEAEKATAAATATATETAMGMDAKTPLPKRELPVSVSAEIFDRAIAAGTQQRCHPPTSTCGTPHPDSDSDSYSDSGDDGIGAALDAPSIDELDENEEMPMSTSVSLKGMRGVAKNRVNAAKNSVERARKNVEKAKSASSNSAVVKGIKSVVASGRAAVRTHRVPADLKSVGMSNFRFEVFGSGVETVAYFDPENGGKRLFGDGAHGSNPPRVALLATAPVKKVVRKGDVTLQIDAESSMTPFNYETIGENFAATAEAMRSANPKLTEADAMALVKKRAKWAETYQRQARGVMHVLRSNEELAHEVHREAGYGPICLGMAGSEALTGVVQQLIDPNKYNVKNLVQAYALPDAFNQTDDQKAAAFTILAGTMQRPSLDVFPISALLAVKTDRDRVSTIQLESSGAASVDELMYDYPLTILPIGITSCVGEREIEKSGCADVTKEKNIWFGPPILVPADPMRINEYKVAQTGSGQGRRISSAIDAAMATSGNRAIDMHLLWAAHKLAIGIKTMATKANAGSNVAIWKKQVDPMWKETVRTSTAIRSGKKVVLGKASANKGTTKKKSGR